MLFRCNVTHYMCGDTIIIFKNYNNILEFSILVLFILYLFHAKNYVTFIGIFAFFCYKYLYVDDIKIL